MGVCDRDNLDSRSPFRPQEMAFASANPALGQLPAGRAGREWFGRH